LKLEKRCDYLLVEAINGFGWFIELKGADGVDVRHRGHSTWAKAFEQLFTTYLRYSNYINQKRPPSFILATSLDRAPNARYTSYPFYRRIRELLFEIEVQFSNNEPYEL
jgi:hypothetical protein